MSEADKKNPKKICPICKAGYVWPTSGYSYNVPSTNNNNVDPNNVGKYPYPAKKKKGKAFPNPKSAPTPAPSTNG